MSIKQRINVESEYYIVNFENNAREHWILPSLAFLTGKHKKCHSVRLLILLTEPFRNTSRFLNIRIKINCKFKLYMSFFFLGEICCIETRPRSGRQISFCFQKKSRKRIYYLFVATVMIVQCTYK